MEKTISKKETPDSMKPGLVRKDLYKYLEAEGFNVTEPRHKAISAMVKDHARRTHDATIRDRNNAVESIKNASVPVKDQTMIKRLEGFRCPVCGRDMKDRGKGEYVTQCGHLDGMMFTYA